jgi:hypothetical protein
MPVIPAIWEVEIGGQRSEAGGGGKWGGESLRPYLKNKEAERAWGVSQVVERLPTKLWVLSTNSSTANQEKKKKKPENKPS